MILGFFVKKKHLQTRCGCSLAATSVMEPEGMYFFSMEISNSTNPLR